MLNLRKLILTAVVFAVIGGSVGTTAQAHNVGNNSEKTTLQQQANYFKANANHAMAFLKVWNDIRGWQILDRHHWVQFVPEPAEVVYHRRLLKNAMRGLAIVQRKLTRILIPHYNGWLCIHHYEGAWNDPNPPYYGGLQMDYGFQSTYAPELLSTKGTADHWTPLEQMMVAERAYKSGRGYGPWPNTARYCGLL